MHQQNWENPCLADWMHSLENAVNYLSRPPLLVAHSVGCLLVLHWALRSSLSFTGLLLVAPADSQQENFPPVIQGFAPIPQAPVGKPGIVAGSQNDPYMSQARCRTLTRSIGLNYYDCGRVGHINLESGFGPWPLVEQWISELRSNSEI